MRWFALSLLACLVAVARPASAHKPSDSYLTLSSQAEVALVRWDIALRDLDEVVGLDTDGDGNVTWGELERAKPLVFATCLRSLQLSSAGQSCRGEAVKLRAIRHSDGAYAVVDLRFVCAGPIERADVKYDLLFDVDAQHRGIAHVGKQGSPVTFSAGERQRTLDFTGASAPGLGSLIGLGALHIWHGYDHLLFLLALLLPAVVRRSEAHWVPVASFGPTT